MNLGKKNMSLLMVGSRNEEPCSSGQFVPLLSSLPGAVDSSILNRQPRRVSSIGVGMLLLLFLAGGIGCAATKTANHQEESQNQQFPTGGGGSVNQGLLAECNRINSPETDFDVQLATYFDPATGTPEPAYINTHISALPDDVLNSDDYYIQVFRWAEDVSGASVLNPEPTGIVFVDRLTGIWVNRDRPEATISRQVMLNIIGESQNINATVATFFNHFLIVLTNVSYNYDALSFALYSRSAQQPLRTFDGLIPPFSADPNIYIANHSSSVLHGLHPNYIFKDSGGTQDSFLSNTSGFCSSFF